MTQTVLSRDGFSTTTPISESSRVLTKVGTYEISTSSSPNVCAVVVLDYSQQREVVPENHISVEDLIAELAQGDDRMAREIVEARKWVGENFYGEHISLKSLRLAQGLTQAELARQIGTSQPHIARIENGQTSLQIETMRKLSEALKVDMNTIDSAFRQAESESGSR